MTKAEKWLLKIVLLLVLLCGALTYLYIISAQVVKPFDLLSIWSLPLGVVAGWSMITIIEEKKKK